MSALPPPKADMCSANMDAFTASLRTGFEGLERKRVYNFICCHNSIGVVREIDLERGVHLFTRVIRRRVFDHRDLVAKLGGKANGRFDAGMRYQTDDDELMDAVLLEL